MSGKLYISLRILNFFAIPLPKFANTTAPRSGINSGGSTQQIHLAENTPFIVKADLLQSRIAII